MRGKYIEREQAIRLRRQGVTISAIAEQLNVSKASVSLWMKGVVLPIRARLLMQERAARNRALAHEARREATTAKLAEAQKIAIELATRTRVNADGALVLSALMYWCEGTKIKGDGEFTFTNADPMTVRGFLALLRCAVPLDESRFRIKMHLHEYHDEAVQRRFWSKVTGIPETQFQRTFWKPHTKKSLKINYPGCVHVRYHDVRLSRQICATARAFLTSPVVLK